MYNMQTRMTIHNDSSAASTSVGGTGKADENIGDARQMDASQKAPTYLRSRRCPAELMGTGGTRIARADLAGSGAGISVH